MPLPHTARGKLAPRMARAAGQGVCAQRKQIVEPGLGRFKHNWGVYRCRLRGRRGAQVEGTLLGRAHNLSKLIRAGGGTPAGGGSPVGGGPGLGSGRWLRVFAPVFGFHNLYTKAWGGLVGARA